MVLNTFGIIVLAALAVGYVLGMAADWLNVRSLAPAPPPELASLYDNEAYARSQEYTSDRTRVGMVSRTVGFAAVIVFWALGGFGAVDEWVRTPGWGPIPTGTLYIASLALAQSLLSLPFDVYATFVIEERYGFNRTTWKTWVGDRVKGLALALVVGIPLTAAILAFFNLAGDPAWLYCWMLVAVISLAVQYVAPTWIMPLFNRFEPLEEGSLRTRLPAFAESVDFPLSSVMVMDGSKRSSKANAFFTGFGRNRRVALFDTLIEGHSEDELVAIVAHEIGHYKKRHILMSTVLSLAHTGVLFFLLSLVLDSTQLYEAFSVATPSIHVGMVLFGLLYTPVELVLSVVMGAISRRHEFEADRFAATATGRPDWLATGLKRLTVDHLGNLTPHPFYVWLTYSHPPLLARLQALKSIEPEVHPQPSTSHGEV